MKSVIKGFLALSAMTLCCTVASTLFNSCANNDSQEIEDASHAREFLGFCRSNCTEYMTADVISKDVTTKGGITRAVLTPQKDLVPLYITIPEEAGMSNEECVKKLDEAESVKDILILAEEIGIEYSTEYKKNCNYALQLSESKAKESLNPLVNQSKQYLYSKGFTDKEIEEMLQENNVDETELVPFVMRLSTLENSAQNMASLHQRKLGVFSLLATPAYAQAGDCAMKALGADFLFGVSGSSLKTWGKAAIKKAFKSVAKKMLGPIGALIAVVEFSYCMWG